MNLVRTLAGDTCQACHAEQSGSVRVDGQLPACYRPFLGSSSGSTQRKDNKHNICRYYVNSLVIIPQLVWVHEFYLQ